jgi:medium-chain acyl-[acyl-carrier-protein] hydrolase
MEENKDIKRLTETFRVTTNMRDFNDNIKPSAAFDLAQELAAEHATLWGKGFNDYYQKGWYWVVARNYLKVVKPATHIEKLTLTTYAYKNQFVEYPRDIEVRQNGELVGIIKEIWMVYDFKNGHVVNDPTLNDFASDCKSLIDGRIRKLPIIPKESLKYIKDVEVTYSYADTNKHMNNTKYFDIYFDIVCDNHGRNYSTIQAEYVKQCFVNDILHVYLLEEDDANYMYIYKNEELTFYLKVTF